MGSFFRNLLKPKDSNNDNTFKKSNTKWLFMFRKTNETMDKTNINNGQENNQGKIRTSNSASSVGSITLSDQSFTSDGLLLLPILKTKLFVAPNYILIDEWIRSQVFEVVHLLASFVDLVSKFTPKLSKNLETELDQILSLLEQKYIDFKLLFHQVFSVVSTLYKEEIDLWTTLKFEAHFNSLMAQLVELCSQLPGKSLVEITESLYSKGFFIDMVAYKSTLAQNDSQLLSIQD